MPKVCISSPRWEGVMLEKKMVKHKEGNMGIQEPGDRSQARPVGERQLVGERQPLPSLGLAFLHHTSHSLSN